MPAKVSVGLFAGHEQEVGIRMAAACFEVLVLLVKADLSGIVGMAIAVKVRHYRDVDAKAAERCDPRWPQIEGAGIDELLVEVRVEMADRDLVTVEALVPVAVGVSQNFL